MFVLYSPKLHKSHRFLESIGQIFTVTISEKSLFGLSSKHVRDKLHCCLLLKYLHVTYSSGDFVALKTVAYKELLSLDI